MYAVVQKKALLMTKPVLQKAIQDMCTSSISSRSTVVVADLGCSSGPNTLLVVDEVMSTLRDCTREAETTDEDDWRSMQVQFFLNDLPGNDFNLVFRSLQQLQDFDVEEEDETVALPCYVAGLPGSYYRRLFPCQSVHLFHSSYSLMWRSKVHMHVTLLHKEKKKIVILERNIVHVYNVKIKVYIYAERSTNYGE